MSFYTSLRPTLAVSIMLALSISCRNGEVSISPEPSPQSKADEVIFLDVSLDTLFREFNGTIPCVPEQLKGKVVGVRIFLKASGAKAAIPSRPEEPRVTIAGFQSGDRLDQADGVVIATAEQAFEAFKRAGKDSEVRLSLIRLGQHRELVYQPQVR